MSINISRYTLKAALIFFALIFFTFESWAQFDDAPPIQIDQAERQRLRSILDSEIDQSQLNTKKIEQHKQKELAAAALGDFAAREKNLREWMLIDQEGAWVLRSVLSNTERRAEAYEIGHSIIQKERRPIVSARMKLYVASDYIEDNELVKASELFLQTEGVIRSMPRSGRNGEQTFLLLDTEIFFI